MATMLKASGVGKRFSLYTEDRPRTFKELLSPRVLRPRSRGELWALRGVDLEVGEGEMLGVIGHNGSGKSTLLRVLGGVMRADEGTVERAAHVNGLLELNTGMHPDLSGRENILINGVVAGLTREEVVQRFDAIVDFAELEPFIDNPVRTYSSGMKLRLGFAVAAHVRPRILLIDEILSVGDIAFQEKCLQRIQEFKRDGCAIVLITHDLSQVEQSCDRAIWLRKGQVAAVGSPEMLVGEYRAEMLAETSRRTPGAAAAQMTAGGQHLVLNENRFGSLETVIQDVRLLDGDRREVRQVGGGDSLTVRFTVTPSGQTGPLFASVTIGTEAHEDCIDVNTDGDRIELSGLAHTQTVEVSFDRLDLATGDYAVSVGIYAPDWSYAHDYHWRAYPLRIEAPQKAKGILSPPRRWTVSQGGAP
ncbi:MAG: hypothetical protein BGN86_01095 [Caulobacterales bacterium 68-7]|nr:ABC transporter ATP-binding protein [Caulobacterales bacterium]OJU12594.1 MAG: hypothetical protein BGN86_01095 [Caulobacterales bacterium 68-7]